MFKLHQNTIREISRLFPYIDKSQLFLIDVEDVLEEVEDPREKVYKINLQNGEMETCKFKKGQDLFDELQRAKCSIAVRKVENDEAQILNELYLPIKPYVWVALASTRESLH